MWCHIYMEDKFLIIFKSFLDIFNLFGRKRHSQGLIDVEFQLSEVKFLTHIEVPVWFWGYAWNEPICIIEILLFNLVLTFWLRQRPQEIRGEKVGLQLIIREIIRLNFKVWEDIGLHHVDHYVRSGGAGASSGLSAKGSRIAVLKWTVVWDIWFVNDYRSCEGISFRPCDMWHHLNMIFHMIFNIGKGDNCWRLN